MESGAAEKAGKAEAAEPSFPPTAFPATPSWFAVLISFALPACHAPLSGGANPAGPLARMEESYQQLRYWDDQRRLLESLGAEVTPDGVPLGAVSESLRVSRDAFEAARKADATLPTTDADVRARAAMLQAWHGGLAAGESGAAGGSPATCDYDADVLAAEPGGLDRLTARVLECYGRAANTIVVDGDTLNRLAILGQMARTADPGKRRRLFLALEPVWQSVNGGNGASSPYRVLLRLRRAAWGDTASPIERKAPAFGLTTAQLERWLSGALGEWRDAMPDTLLEPWDWYYYAGEASRRLSSRVPGINDIRRVNDRFYQSLGADPESLGIHYDLAARPGKYPVAYTDFGSRNRWQDGRMVPGQPWVFTAYLAGGFDNLGELLHETGHGIHIAAIRTRPAWADWPDNDTFTEALADLLALELFEPRWQQRFLGDSVPLAASLRARYAGIVFDMAWALFEIQVHRKPAADPNALWSGITSEYLGIVPHPEWSWWAVRGQLIDGPGYLVNYALGAFLTADMRARAGVRRHSFADAEPALYPWLSAELYHFGRERPSREVLERFLGGPVRPDPLLTDLRRMTGKPPR